MACGLAVFLLFVCLRSGGVYLLCDIRAHVLSPSISCPLLKTSSLILIASSASSRCVKIGS